MSTRSFSMADEAVIIFLKAPRKGLVKTRLSRSLDDEGVLLLYKAFVADTLDAVRGVADIHIGYWPPDEGEKIRGWLGQEYDYFPQKGENLGEKMAQSFKRIFQNGYSKAILVGTDIPQFNREIAIKAFKALDKTDLALGPSKDGGYYLIGFNRSGYQDRVFEEICWSSHGVLTQTKKSAQQANLSYCLVEELNDMDTIEDLKWLTASIENEKFCVGERTAFLLKKMGRNLVQSK